MDTISFKFNSETELPQDMIDGAPSNGPFDSYAEDLLDTYDIDVTLADSIKYLKEFGVWELDELQDIELNKARILWQACLYCKEEKTQYFYMGS